ncbi:hypothetical protein Tco_0049186, partial [Tanacetum coccineum]
MNSAREEIVKKIGEEDELPQKTHVKEPGTFTEKVKRCIKEEQKKGDRLLEILEKEPINTPLVNTIRQTPDYTKCLQELASEKIKNRRSVYGKVERSMFGLILDIVEDDKVPIILRRPMLATTLARIDIFGRKISLEVGTERVVFNANKGKTPLS